jgi:hypothetical protein
MAWFRKVLAVALIVAGSGHAANADTTSVSPSDAIGVVGHVAQVCGLVASTSHATGTRGQPTFLNLDKPYPNHVFTAVIWGRDRSRFSYAPESLKGKRICVTGTVELYKGRAEIVVSDPAQIQSKS